MPLPAGDAGRLERTLREGRSSLDALMATIRRSRGETTAACQPTATTTTTGDGVSVRGRASSPALHPSTPKRLPTLPASPHSPEAAVPAERHVGCAASLGIRLPSPPSPLRVPEGMFEAAAPAKRRANAATTTTSAAASAATPRDAHEPPSAAEVPSAPAVGETPAPLPAAQQQAKPRPVLRNVRAVKKVPVPATSVVARSRRSRTPPSRSGGGRADGIAGAVPEGGGSEVRLRNVRITRRARTPPARSSKKGAGGEEEGVSRSSRCVDGPCSLFVPQGARVTVSASPSSRGGSPGSSSRSPPLLTSSASNIRDCTPPPPDMYHSRGPRTSPPLTLLSPSDGSRPNETSPSPTRDMVPTRVAAALANWHFDENDPSVF